MEPERRPLTEEERASLMPALSHPPSLALIAAGLALGTMLLVGVPLVALAVNTLGMSRSAIPAVLLVVLAGSFAVWLRTLARRARRPPAVDFEADVNEGVAALRRVRVTDALRAVMEEHRERAYFVKLNDGSILFIGYWNPAEDDNPALIHDLPADPGPSEDLTIAQLPRTGHIVDVTFSGTPLRDVRTIVFRQGHGLPQLESGDPVPVPWGEIEKTYGG